MEDELEKFDELPTREKMKFKYECGDNGWGRGRYADVPWTRINAFVAGCVGMHWNDVCSKFIKLPWVKAKYRNVHFLDNFAEVNTFMHDGKVCVICRWEAYRVVENTRSECLYVHPNTGILCLAKPKPIKCLSKREKEVKKGCIVLKPYTQLLKLKGIWYLVTGKLTDHEKKHIKPNAPLISEGIDGKLRHHCSCDPDGTLSYFSKVELTRKQLSSKELKKYGLAND